MRDTIPILICDHEDDCGQWMVDHYGMEVDNWRDLLRGWAFDPHADTDTAYCPDHKGDNR